MDGINSLGVWPNQPPKSHQLMAVIRFLMKQGKFTLRDRAEKRLEERDADMNDAINVVKSGDIDGPIEPGKKPFEWECKIVSQPRYPDNMREMGVAMIVVRTTGLLLKTVEWEDLK